jgi:hypothetical protein
MGREGWEYLFPIGRVFGEISGQIPGKKIVKIYDFFRGIITSPLPV